MKCKNCGAKVPNDSSICSNCGAVVDPNSQYVLLTNDAKPVNSQKAIKENKKKKRNNFFFTVIACILIVAAGFGSYYYFFNQNMDKPQPQLDFYAGYGIINEDEQIVYVNVKDSAKIEYIQGVTCYDKKMYYMENGANKVSSNYQYTKNVDNSIRSIYFDMSDLKVEKGKNYTYTFEMKFSFHGDENVYTYYQPVNFVGTTKNNISEIVFDHTKQDTKKTNEQTTTQAIIPTEDYLYDYYWYSAPVAENKEYAIFALKLNKDKTLSYTAYHMNVGSPWDVKTSNGTYKIKNDRITINLEDANESFQLIFDKENKALYDVDLETNNKSDQYTARDYNSLSITKSFFGL